MNKNYSSFTADKTVFQRIYQATNCKTQKELAHFLGVQQSTISAMTKRKNIPSSWLLTMLMKKNISPMWILFEESLPFLFPSKEENTISQSPKVDIKEKDEQEENKEALSKYKTEELLQEISARMGKNVTFSLQYTSLVTNYSL